MSEVEVTEGSDNVFADLELPNADEELLKAQLTYQIWSLIEKRGLSPPETADLLDIRQSQAAMLARNRSGSFSVARLMRFLAKLGQDVQITVRPKAPENVSGRVQLIAQPA